jgi:hypothetical protein
VIFMKNTSLCYIQRGDEYLMLHRVKKEKDENATNGSASAASSSRGKARRNVCSGRPLKRPA